MKCFGCQYTFISPIVLCLYFGLRHTVFVVVWLFSPSHRHHATEIILYLPAFCSIQHLQVTYLPTNICFSAHQGHRHHSMGICFDVYLSPFNISNWKFAVRSLTAQYNESLERFTLLWTNWEFSIRIEDKRLMKKKKHLDASFSNNGFLHHWHLFFSNGSSQDWNTTISSLHIFSNGQISSWQKCIVRVSQDYSFVNSGSKTRLVCLC